MSTPLVSSLTEILLSFAPVFSQPSFANFMTLVPGWVFCFGRHTVTGIICAAGAVGKKHFSCYHRFFSRAVWNLDSVGRIVLKLALPFVPDDETVLFAVDDTLGRKTGKHIWGAAMHHDPLRSTARKNFFSFGHSWVVLSIQVAFPFAPKKRFALPFLFRLYRKKKKKRGRGRPKGERKQTGEARPGEYRTRPEFAVEMIRIAAGWLSERRIVLVGDSEYSGKSVSRSLPENVTLVGRMPMNAALYAQPPVRKPHERGRTRKKGERLPNPAELAASHKVRWTKSTVDIYCRAVKVWFKTTCALWYNSAGTRPVTVVVVRDPSGRRRDDCFFTTDPTMSATGVIETIARRWPLEVTFHDAKQMLGFEEPQNRTEKAVTRTAPMALVLYSLVVLWYARAGREIRERWFVKRAWYRKKKSASFADMLATLRQASWAEANFLDPGVKVGSKESIEQRIAHLQRCLLMAA